MSETDKKPKKKSPSSKSKKTPEAKKPWNFFFWMVMAVGLIFILQSEGDSRSDEDAFTLKSLREDLNSYTIDKVTYQGGELTWYLGEGTPKDIPQKKMALVSEIPDDMMKLIELHTKGLIEKAPSMWFFLLGQFGPWLMLLLVFYFLFFRQMKSSGPGGIFSFGKSKAMLVKPEDINKSFKDVAGVDEAKEELSEVVAFLKSPDKFTKLGGRLPRGVLLQGPPGTGKTLLAKAIAGEAGVPFYSISGSDFVEMFVGVGASRVRDLFTQAKENSPSIIFLDEIDAVGRRRGSGLGGGHDEREQTLNAILVEMDGFKSGEGVIVIASTNRADVLDPALLRPGRFDRHVSVDLPDIEGRKDILLVHSKKIKLSSDVILDLVAQGTTGFSGADLENLLNESALIAVRRNGQSVNMSHLYEARDKIAFGKSRKSKIVHEDDLKITAYHEAGHAIVSLNTKCTMTLEKITIIPFGRAAGANFYRPERDDEHLTKNKILGNIQRSYGGRIAEQVFFDDISAGAANDIQQATGMAKKMVMSWGMSERSGLINYEPSEERMFLGGEITRSKSYSEATAKILDEEIRSILDSCYKKAEEIIREHRDALVRVAEALLVYESLSGDEVITIASGQDIKRKPPVDRVLKTVNAETQSENAEKWTNPEFEEKSEDDLGLGADLDDSEKNKSSDKDSQGPSHIDTEV